MSKHSVKNRVAEPGLPVVFLPVTEAELDVDMPQDRIIRSCDDLARKLKRNQDEDGVAYFVDDELMYFVSKQYFLYNAGDRNERH